MQQAWGRPCGTFATSSVAGTATGWVTGNSWPVIAAANDAVAFEALVARHGPMVLATCRAVLKNEHDVEDAFQTTFLVLARKAHSIRAGDTLGGWLHRVAYRAAVQASVEAKKRRRKEAEASAMAPCGRITRPGLPSRRRLAARSSMTRSTACPKASACRSCFATWKG